MIKDIVSYSRTESAKLKEEIYRS